MFFLFLVIIIIGALCYEMTSLTAFETGALSPCFVLVGVRDVNGDPIPANPWGIPLLGYGYETKIVPMGMDMGQNLHPLGKRVWVWEAIIRTRLPMGISYVYACRVCMNDTTRNPLINDKQNLSWISKKPSQSHDYDEF
jgi:hypothetical protein